MVGLYVVSRVLVAVGVLVLAECTVLWVIRCVEARLGGLVECVCLHGVAECVPSGGGDE